MPNLFMFIEPHALISYLLAITLLSLTPGADTMLVIRNSARGGWRDGMVSSLGICLGLFVHASISTLGISVILLNTAWAFSMIKLAGAGYIIWLGVGSLRRLLVPSPERFEIDGIQNQARSFHMVRSLREGLISNVLNPKAVVFYMAFLPQFIDPAYSAWIQALFLASCHFIVSMIWQGFLALMVDRAKQIPFRPLYGKLFDGLTGTVLVSLGVKLALTP
jgi:RhtB (resistance to homoserine/threonine) family protein